MLIRKFPTTEKIRQIYLLQLLQYEESRGVVVDLDSINLAFPGFLQTHDFTGIAVDNLFQYIVFETRARTNSIYYMNDNFDYFPDVLYGFCEDDFNEDEFLDFKKINNYLGDLEDQLSKLLGD